MQVLLKVLIEIDIIFWYSTTVEDIASQKNYIYDSRKRNKVI